MKQQRGQAIVLVVIAMLALLALMGLAIDGGRQYTARRQVQNAADAAALAGTRELALAISKCPPDPATTVDARVRDAVLAFAQQNGIQNGVNGIVRANYVNANQQVLVGVGAVAAGAPASSMASATGVSVTLVISQPTTFLRAINVNNLTIPGSAMAMAGPVTTLPGGVMPFTFSVQRLENIYANGGGAGTEFKVFEAGPNEGFICERNDVSCTGGSPGDRGWLNLGWISNAAYDTTPRCNGLDRRCETNNSNAQVKGWICNSPYTSPIFAGTRGGPGQYTDGDFIQASPGVRSVSIRDVCDCNADKTIWIPVFDYYDTSRNAYHIVGFAGGTPTECFTQGQSKYVQFRLKESIVGAGQVVPSATGYQIPGGGGACLPKIMGVSLWK